MTEFPSEAQTLPLDLPERLRHVGGKADGFGFVVDRAPDRLPNPMRRVRRETEALVGIEALRSLHEADRALLNEVLEGYRAVPVRFGDIDDQAHVRFDQPLA